MGKEVFVVVVKTRGGQEKVGLIFDRNQLMEILEGHRPTRENDSVTVYYATLGEPEVWGKELFYYYDGYQVDFEEVLYFLEKH